MKTDADIIRELKRKNSKLREDRQLLRNKLKVVLSLENSIKIFSKEEAQELLRGIRLTEKYSLPDVPDLTEIKICLKNMRFVEDE